VIDWTKPIETTDGRKVTVLMLNAVHEGYQHAKPLAVVKIEGDHRDKLGRYSTYLMDGTSWAAEGTVLQIRNVLVKREGWVNIYHVHETEAAAIQCRSQHEGVVTRFVRWEE